jgi:hypothetical protein
MSVKSYEENEKRMNELNDIIDSDKFKNDFDYKKIILKEYFDLFDVMNEQKSFSSTKRKKNKLAKKIFYESLKIQELEVRGILRMKGVKQNLTEKLQKTFKRIGGKK